MSPLPWRVELEFAVASIVAEDGTVVAQNLTPADAEAIVAAMGVVEAAQKHRRCEVIRTAKALDAALSAYEKASWR